MKHTVSKALRDGLQAWWDDATGERPSIVVMSTGVCTGLIHDAYPEFLGVRVAEFGEDRCTYPFGYATYEAEYDQRTAHLNPQRRAFVRRILDDNPLEKYA